MTLEEFVEKFEVAERQTDGSYMCRCVAHDDHNPSLHVSSGDDGRILLKCYAGCSAEAIVSALGLKMSDLMPADGKRKRGKKAVKPSSAERDYGELVAVYDYQNADGKTLYRVERRVKKNGKKTFVQKHPDASAPYGWAYGVSRAGIERVPFHLPRILAAGKSGKSVIVCEGEKDVLSVEKYLNVAATCNAAGAGKWESGWGKWFEGVRAVCIIADNDPLTVKDEKTGEDKPFAPGQRHANDVEAKLRADGYTGGIHKMTMPQVDGQKRVKDFTDWVEAREAAGLAVDKAAFQEAINAFGEWPEEWDKLQAADIDGARAKKNARVTASDDGAEAPEEMGEAGRYGRRSPRSPSENERYYEVDFQINSKSIARFEIGVRHYRFSGWIMPDKDSGDDQRWTRVAHYSPVDCELSQMAGMAIGSLYAWNKDIKISNQMRTALVSSLSLAWLRARGHFFADKNFPAYDTSLYFDDVTGILYKIHSDEFGSFLATESSVNREDKTFKFMMSLIDDMAINPDITPRIIPSKEWDRRGEAIYLSNGDSRICKITGGKIEDVANGTDGVVFVRGSTLSPWKLLEGPGEDPFVSSMLFRYAALEKPADRMNCRLWFMNLFACHTNKPIFLVTGPARSGKTRLIQGMKQFLGMREDGEEDDTVTDIDPTDKGLDNFWIIIDKGRFEIFDNYDAKIKWAENAFQTAATNGSTKRRVLYKTDKLVTLHSNSYIGITSNHPVFATEGGGLPDRIITVHVGSGRTVSIGGELKDSIKENRNAYMTWTARILAAVLADQKPVDKTINQRHPDYGIFSVKVGRAIGDEAGAVQAMSAAEIDKATLPLMNDAISKEIVSVLMNQQPVAVMKEFTATAMAEKIIERLGDDDTDSKSKDIYSARRIGKAFSKFSREFTALFQWSARLKDGRTLYDFNGLTAQGSAVQDSLASGLVGLIGNFGKSPYGGAGASEVLPNTPTEATYPLDAGGGEYTRARASSSSFSREDEDNGNWFDDL